MLSRYIFYLIKALITDIVVRSEKKFACSYPACRQRSKLQQYKKLRCAPELSQGLLRPWIHQTLTFTYSTSCNKSDLIVQTLSERVVPLIVSLRRKPKADYQRYQIRTCYEAAVAHMRPSKPPKRTDVIASPEGVATSRRYRAASFGTIST